MAQRDCTAVWVHKVCIGRDAQLFQRSDDLSGESLVDFNQIEVADAEAQPVEQLAGGRDRADAAATLRTLREAALSDENGYALSCVLSQDKAA